MPVFELPTWPGSRAKWARYLRMWGRPPSPSETGQIARTARMITVAVRRHPWFRTQRLRIFIQGSYANNTNVRLNSDMDLCVCLTDGFFMQDAAGSWELHVDRLGRGPTVSLEGLKEHLYIALADRFGASSVSRGNKAIKVRETKTTRVHADVVAAFRAAQRLPRLNAARLSKDDYGIAICPDNGEIMVSFPHHHLKNGKIKNDKTGGKYKNLVRIIKKFRDEMQDAGICQADTVPSFLLESLIYNCPNRCFQDNNIVDRVERVLLYSHYALFSPNVLPTLSEVNGIKPLFSDGQPWIPSEANSFVTTALDLHMMSR